ncbi:zinc finger CCCH domain-containing protein 43-like [Macadamia integrifolia]|uniref:zinc finger CCCH domain-containing protein 43-like n=1 Tax=Macadamia integrifolia TaxID=60698 RepID=UPI001C4F06C8|nr:zinc finger CCCH domain-containing protein 43-like [Macadamia integrifolia]
MESVFKVKTQEEEEFTIHISSPSSPSPPSSPASPSSVDPAVTVDTVDAVVPASVYSTEDVTAPVEILEGEFQTIDLEDNNKDNGEEVAAVIPDLGYSSEDALAIVEILEEEFQNVDLRDDNKDNGDEYDELEEFMVGRDSLVRDTKPTKILYPQRPDAPDCSYYLRTGSCRYGANCRYNHPARTENQGRRSASPESRQGFKEKEDLSEIMGQQECKYYLRSGGCKFGKACRYNHSREKPVVPLPPPAPPHDFNFLGLPIRLGERECPYYMRTGSCKYGSNCRFHHPDPTAVGGGDIPSGSVSLHPSGGSQPVSASWSSPPNETVPYLDPANSYVPMMLPPQGVHPNPKWNGYQAPAYSPERSVHPPLALVPNNPTNRTDISRHNQQHMLDEFPERPGQPECSYFMKTGDCKYRSACKYNHPKNRVPKLSACTLSPMGLPLRPDQSICTHYHRYGICKFGAACKFDHPVNYAF